MLRLFRPPPPRFFQKRLRMEESFLVNDGWARDADPFDFRTLPHPNPLLRRSKPIPQHPLGIPSVLIKLSHVSPVHEHLTNNLSMPHLSAAFRLNALLGQVFCDSVNSVHLIVRFRKQIEDQANDLSLVLIDHETFFFFIIFIPIYPVVTNDFPLPSFFSASPGHSLGDLCFFKFRYPPAHGVIELAFRSSCILPINNNELDSSTDILLNHDQMVKQMS